MTDFLPKDYKEPKAQGKYMKFKKGENRFRVLGSAIVGTEGWVTTDEGRKPVRKRPSESISVSEVDDPSDIKHFWAFPVYNYDAERVQILEITQKTVKEGIEKLLDDDDYGDPKRYDIVVTRKGDGLKTKYPSVRPKPPKKLTKEIKEAWEATNIDLEALYDNEDPFEQDEFDDIAEELGE